MGTGPVVGRRRCITGFAFSWGVVGARLNSDESSTYHFQVRARIIGAEAAATGTPKKPVQGASIRPLPAAVRQVQVGEGGDGQRLDNFLLRLLKGVPKTHVYRLIRSGEVRVNKGRAGADTRLAAGDTVRVPPVRVATPSAALAPPREFAVVFEDDHLLAIDKPAGVAVHGGSGVSFGVIEQLRRARPEARFLELVHRLDKETSGLLLLAKKRSALKHLQDQFRERGTEKNYAALVFGDWPAQRKVIDLPLLKATDAQGERHVRVVGAGHEAAQRSISVVQVVRRLGGCTLLDVRIATGRTHQIRVHLAHAGCPIVGDPKYGDFARNKSFARDRRFERMFLHARRLAFDHPASGDRVVLEAPLPADCAALLDTLA